MPFLNKAISSCKKRQKCGLRFIQLNIATTCLTVFVDAGFATNNDLTSQLVYLIILINNDGNANIVHYGSIKLRSVTRSVLAAELFAITHGFDVASTLRLAGHDTFGRIAPMKFYTDSRRFDCLTNISSNTKEELLIDRRILRQSYKRREISEVFWIPTSQKPADAFTKPNPCNAIRNVL